METLEALQNVNATLSFWDILILATVSGIFAGLIPSLFSFLTAWFQEQKKEKAEQQTRDREDELRRQKNEQEDEQRRQAIAREDELRRQKIDDGRYELLLGYLDKLADEERIPFEVYCNTEENLEIEFIIRLKKLAVKAVPLLDKDERERLQQDIEKLNRIFIHYPDPVECPEECENLWGATLTNLIEDERLDKKTRSELSKLHELLPYFVWVDGALKWDFDISTTINETVYVTLSVKEDMYELFQRQLVKLRTNISKEARAASGGKKSAAQPGKADVGQDGKAAPQPGKANASQDGKAAAQPDKANASQDGKAAPQPGKADAGQDGKSASEN